MSEITPVKDLLRVVDHAANIVGTYGRTRQMPQRVDRMALASLVAEHANQEMEHFIRFLYTPSPAVGRFLNLYADGSLRQGVWTPWSTNIAQASQLSRPQRRVLCKWAILKSEDRAPSVLIYEAECRRWRVNLPRFSTLDVALGWLGRHQITGNEWLVLEDGA
jgi:hypothetical protein